MALVIGKGIGPPAVCKRKNDERGNSGRYRAVIGCGEEISGTAMYSSFMSERECHMRIRPYIESRDFASVETWIEDEKIHALWCADLIPYPVTKENFHAFLEKNALEWTDSAYVATEKSGELIGFFCYSVNADEDAGFLKLVIVDRNKRGSGYGNEMLKLALRYAFEITGVKTVRLNVFDENAAAKHVYEKVGFREDSIDRNVFSFKGELWSRCHMTAAKRGPEGSDKT